jgi:hypothetical protein
MKREPWDAPEWVRGLRGWPAHTINGFLHPLCWGGRRPWLFRVILWLAPYEGDWAFRDERRERRRETVSR